MTASRPRILVIDDEPQIHRFLGPALEAAGYEPVRADTGAEGLKKLAGMAPDAVVLDLGLPDMDGRQALEKARAFFSGPILILSARDDPMIPPDTLESASLPPAVRLHMTDRGGHLGFVGRRGVDADRRWMDWRVVDWVLATSRRASPPAAAVRS